MWWEDPDEDIISDTIFEELECCVAAEAVDDQEPENPVLRRPHNIVIFICLKPLGVDAVFIEAEPLN
jgi:hypothetical protein